MSWNYSKKTEYNNLLQNWKMTFQALELVTRNYWWLGVMRNVGRYMEGYDLC